MRRPRRSEDFREYSKVLRYARAERHLKPFKKHGSSKVALIFPNSYEVAGSSLAFSFVRDLLNLHPDLLVERFFYDPSFKKFYSIESQTPLDEFRVWLFSVHFELDVFNVLEILSKRSIPISWKERRDSDPVVIIGGSMTYFNAFSLWSVADAIYHGDLEAHLENFSEALTLRSKEEILQGLSKIPAMSVPYLGKFGVISKVRDINSIPPVSSYVPGHGEFSGMLLIEIGRGCIRRCAFCVAGYTQKPVRFMKMETFKDVLRYVPKDVKLGLVSATVTDYPWLEDLLDALEGRKFSVSSMRIDGLNLRLLKALKDSGQRSFTIAPEGGSQKIRDVLMKDITEEEIDRGLKLGREAGFSRLKMYFIYGMDEEDESDLESIVELSRSARDMGYSVKVSLNPLIPKPGTPFQGRKIQDIKTLRDKERFLKEGFRRYGIRADFESIKESVVQFEIANMDIEGSEDMMRIFKIHGKKGFIKHTLRRWSG